MKLFKKISFSLFVLIYSTHLIANDCLPLDECCDAAPSFCSLDGLTFKAEGLYLWAGETDLQFASENHFAQSQDNNVSATKISSKYKSPNFSNRLGYRVGLDYLNPCSCVGLSVTYFHFKTNAHGSVSAPVNASVNGKIGSESTFVSLLFANSIDEQNSFNKCSSNLKLQVNLLDFDFGRTFCYSSCFSFRPFIGVRYADISENYKIKSNGVQSGSDRLQDILTNAKTQLKNGFTGFGIHAGVDSEWSIACGFSLYGKAAGSILYGRTHRTNLIDYLLSDFGNGTINGYQQHVKANQHGPRTILELGIGIKWNYCICEGQDIGLKLGWEQLLFLNNNRFDNSISGEKGSSFAFSRNGDLGLQGIVFGADYSF